MEADLPEDIRRFLADHIGSVIQLELLLLLASDANRSWSATNAAKSLYISPEAALGFLEGMRQQGFCQAVGEPPVSYRFAPSKPEWERLTRELATLYAERRVTIINLIYAGPAEKFQRFADAFRFRRDK